MMEVTIRMSWRDETPQARDVETGDLIATPGERHVWTS
jgi:hypothetical protein